jgi:hypothetical protein
MTTIVALWLPILVSAAIVFVASSLIHMVLPWHKSDYPKMPNEDAVMEALRPLAIPPGDYLIPRPATRADLRSPEFADKLARGPVVLFTVMPNGSMAMGRSLALWFVYLVVIGIFAAYVAGRVLPPGAEYGHVFRFAGVTAFVSHALGIWPMSIWYRRSWSLAIKTTIDGLIYALLTAGTFGWLWPK